jgi:cytochrome c oxidase cbb3-type subunit 4
MAMTYEAVSEFSKSWGLVYLVVMFLGVCAYAFWPRNGQTFDRASQVPLDKDDV